MKNLIWVLLLLLFFQIARAQITNIPDPNFKQALLSLPTVDINNDGKADVDADTNNDGEIDLSETAGIAYIQFQNLNIDSIDGIEQFTNLQSLHLSYNKIKKLTLKDLYKLEKIDLTGNYLHNLFLDNLPELTNFTAYTINYELGDQQYFRFVNLPNLSVVFGNMSLNRCYFENLPKLKSISFTACTKGTFKNLSKLENVNIAGKIQSLSLVDLPSLSDVLQFGDLTDSLIIVNAVKKTNSLFSLTCKSTKYVELQNLSEITSAKILNSEIQALYIINAPKLIEIDIVNNEIPNVTFDNLPLINTIKIGNNGISKLVLKSISTLTLLDCSKNYLETLDLTAVPNLNQLICFQNLLKNLQLSSLANLKLVDCSENPLVLLDITNNLQLEQLACNKTSIKQLKIENLSSLIFLSASNNDSLKTLRLESLEQLSLLYCSGSTLLHLVNIPPLSYFSKIGGSMILENSLIAEETLHLLTYDQSGLTSEIKIEKLTLINYPINSRLYVESKNNQPFYSIDSIVFKSSTMFQQIEFKDIDIRKIEFENKNHLNTFIVTNAAFDTLLISDFPNLSTFRSENNTQLKSLRFSNLPNFTICSSVNDKINSIDFQNTPKLNYLALITNAINQINLNELTELQTLIIAGTLIHTIDISKLNKIVTFNCSSNSLDSLSISNLPLLNKIYCQDNNLQKIELTLLPNLQILDCSNNLIDLINLQGCRNLIELNCSGNTISKLSDSLLHLKSINVANNQISHIDLLLFPVVENLSCQNNLFKDTLELKGHDKLIAINCSRNQIQKIKFHQLRNLKSLVCTANQIKFLDLVDLPLLNRIDCDSNAFEELLLKDMGLITIDVSNNKDLRYLTLINLRDLRSVYNVNTPLEYVISKDQWVFNNALNLYNGALPIYNPNLKYICCSDKNISAIKSKLNSLGIQNCEVNSYCSFTPGSIFYSLIGKTLLDADNNGCDSNDVKIPNVKFTITGGTESGTIIANASGSYFFPFQTGTHTIQPSLENQTHFTVSPPSRTLNPPFSQNQYIQDFCFTPKDVISNLDLSISPKSPPARPGFNVQYSIVMTNTGNQIENGILNFDFEGTKMDFVYSDLVPTNQSDESLSWNYIDLLPYETRKFNVEFRVNSPFDNPPINAGDELVFTCTTTNHNFTLKQIVVGSYDPNDKTCLQGNAITPEMVGDYVHYQIRFENTGNYAAENIVVKDVIDTTYFNVSSLRITDSSHEVWARIKGNLVEFIFENIQLPFNDENNDGYITFKIKTKPDLDLGVELKNEANIYFDYNLPILTNEVKTVVAIPDFTHDEFETTHFEVFPNPAANSVEYLSSFLVYKAEVYSIEGRLLQSSLYPGNEIEVKHLPSGSYVLKIYTHDKVQVGRFMVK